MALPRAPVSPASWDGTSPARAERGGRALRRAAARRPLTPAPPGCRAGCCPISHAKSPQSPAHCPQGPGARLILWPSPCTLLGKVSLFQQSVVGRGPGLGLKSL